MPRAHSSEDTVSLSFLDMLSCALGATVLLYLVLNSSSPSSAVTAGASSARPIDGVLTLRFNEPLILAEPGCERILEFLPPGTYVDKMKAFDFERQVRDGERHGQSPAITARPTELTALLPPQLVRNRFWWLQWPLEYKEARQITLQIHQIPEDVLTANDTGPDACGRPRWMRTPDSQRRFTDAGQSATHHTLVWRQQPLPRRFGYRACVPATQLWPSSEDDTLQSRFEGERDFSLELSWRGKVYEARARANVEPRSDRGVCYRLDVPLNAWKPRPAQEQD